MIAKAEAPMADILVRNLPPATLARLKRRAAAQGRSLQQELFALLVEAGAQEPADALRLAARLRRRLVRTHPVQDDSAALVRQDRDR